MTGHPEQYHAADASRLGAVGLDLATTMLGRHLVADAHHISVRSLHRLFEAEDTTVASYIRDLRLARCRRDLTDPALRSLPAQAVAARWGFPDKAHFSRAFRAAYGITPQEHRDGGSDLARILNRKASTVNSLPAD
ncbi:helix-turn-helix transcriptional regulator [Micromonospora sp. DT231]|uniref:helix-turn-helix transcriptional regulator n=1 Tax=Micromonospora sp. DT231 TaxID=3416526 RepID=UPI003CEB012B